jgi:hypothetical protein
MTDDQWGGDTDPLEDMKKAIAKMKEPTPESHYRAMDECEAYAQEAIRLLTEEGKTPKEIERIFMKYGIW